MKRASAPPTAALALLAACLCAATAWAEPPSLRKQVEDAILAGDEASAVRLIDDLIDDLGNVERARVVEGGRAAYELLPHATGNARAATLLAEALERDDSEAGGAWRLAIDLQRRLLADLDYAAGEPFARRIARVYPEEPYYLRELGKLQVDTGRPRAARETFERVQALAPSDVDTLRQLAAIEEKLGNAREAVRLWDRVIETRDELRSHYTRARVLAGARLRAYEKALEGIAVGLDKARNAPPGEVRDYYLEQFDQLKARVESDIEQRDRLVALDVRLDRILWALGAGWLVLLGGGVALLRRSRLI